MSDKEILSVGKIYETTQDLGNTDEIRSFLNNSSIELIEIPQLPFEELPFKNLIKFLLSAGSFNWALPGESTETLIKLRDNLNLLTEDNIELQEEIDLFISEVKMLMEKLSLVNNGHVSLGLRNFFCYGDTILHVDNMAQGNAIRFLWAMGRPSGMQYTLRNNVNAEKYSHFINRELYLIQKMDLAVFTQNKTIEEVWSHRPKQIDDMKMGICSYLIDDSLMYQVPKYWSSLHRVETPDYHGTFHRNTFYNRESPGLQLLLTSVSK